VKAARTDANQVEIVAALRKAGAKVYVSSSFGKGFPDLLALYQGQLFMLEVKDGSKPPSAQKLTKDQEKFHADWPVVVVNSIAAAFRAVGIKDAEGLWLPAREG
jgi:Holliday junction resolvase